MGSVNRYFFDSYALIEMYKGNKSYEKYASCEAVTTYFNLYECYYYLLRQKNRKEAEELFDEIRKICINLKFEWIKEASGFKLENKKKKVSYVDCLGYIIAKEMNMPFLTGDMQFKEMSNVEFVK